MNEITRIHIAKVPYNIEPLAKKQLSAYLDSLRQYVGDDSIVDDIEIRMTEILQERSVSAEGTIETKDVMAIVSQLGEPSEFYDVDTEVASTTTIPGKRRLFREPVGALLGGVAMGIAEYIGVSAWVIRVVIVLLAFISFGIVAAIYLLLWIIIPVLRTPAEKLQLLGQPVTANNIKKMGPIPSGNDGMYAKIGRVVLGLGWTLLGLLTIAATSLLAYKYNSVGNYYGFRSLQHVAGYSLSYWHVAVGLFVAAGTFAAALLGTLAYTSFSGRIMRRAVYIMLTMILLSGVTLGTSFGLVHLQENRYGDYLQRHMSTKNLTLPNLNNIQELQVDTDNVTVNYEVSTKTPQATYMVEDFLGPYAAPTVTSKDNVLYVAGNYQQREGFGPIQLTIKGPVLQRITAKRGFVSYQTGGQAALDIMMNARFGFSLSGGKIDNLHGNLTNGADLAANNVALGNVSLGLGTNTSVELGQVGSLSVVLPTSCGSGESANINFDKIGTNTISINGQQMPVDTGSILCGSITSYGVDNGPSMTD